MPAQVLWLTSDLYVEGDDLRFVVVDSGNRFEPVSCRSKASCGKGVLREGRSAGRVLREGRSAGRPAGRALSGASCGKGAQRGRWPQELPPEEDPYSDAGDVIESWQISASNARKAKVRAMQEAKNWLKRVPKMEEIPELPDEPLPKLDMWADFSPLQTARSVRATTPPEDGELANLSIDTAGKEWWRRYHLATYKLSPRKGTDHINEQSPMSQTCTRGTVQKLEEKRKEKAEIKPPAWGCGNGVDPRRKKERKSSALVLPPITSRQALDHGKKNKKKGVPGEEKGGGKRKPRSFKSILRRQATKTIVEPDPMLVSTVEFCI
ncbi:hypothetical protein CYMTET_50274 [Cymbomonas tetramitiformis]|uniref:Uncharacterized protein n=1 Tax=Cymbomonas tetramitiformis TaxID=36881 RepID=A0AAE0ETA6_9CHLO|nr:hypothetical protein CYMTET_50274 [Cymbomonas tetramitiformis]